MDHVGIDLHKRESQICILTDDSEVIEKRIQTTRDRLREFFAKLPRCKVLIEASTDSEWVARHLEQLGHEVIVADPSYAPMYATRSKRVKTDRRDARALAEACKAGIYRAANRSAPEHRRRKSMVTTRAQLVRARTLLINGVRAELQGEGLRLKNGGAESFATRVRAMLPSDLEELVLPTLVSIDALTLQIEAFDRQLEKVAKTDPKVVQLMQVPGVGPIIAIAFEATIGDPKRFDEARKVGAYLGLAPGENSSGDVKRRTSITKSGSTMMRSLLVQAALTIMRMGPKKAPALHAWALGIAGRRNGKVARVALARKLATVLFVMLRDGVDFDPKRGLPMTAAA